jgi:putative DNA primase/helicase
MNRPKFTLSSKGHACPVCDRTKDGDCRISEDSRFVLCHSEINGRQAKAELNGFIWLGPDTTGNWGKWIAKSEDWQKDRPVGEEFRYPFCDRQGQILVHEVRVYRADGKKQWMQPKGVDTAKLVPYKYTEAMAALKNGAEHCLIVEGPNKAESLWGLGLPAVAFPNGFNPSRDSRWFEGFENRLIVVPDRDKPGVDKATRIGQAYPMAKTLRPWPESCWWEPEWLPANGGRDILDWITEMKTQELPDGEIRDRILSAVESGQTPPPRPEESPKSGNQRPILYLDPGSLTKTLAEIEMGLSQSDSPSDAIYAQGNHDGVYLSRVLKATPDNRGSHIEISPDVDHLDLLTPETLLYELNRRFGFERYDARKEDYKAVDCPRNLSTQFLAKGRWPNLPRLTGISHIPLLLRDGRVISEPGFHTETGMLLQFDPGEFPAIPERCIKSDAIAALAVLHDWLREFPFQQPQHRSAALSAVLTAMCRRLLKQALLHAISATKAGTGKGTLARGISILALNGHGGSIPFTGDSEEFRKKITSFLKSGQPIGMIDNVTGVLGGDVLEMVLTEPFFKDRLLGGNQMPSFSTQVTLLANGNNLRFRPDMTRRTILCVLDREAENPELHQFERNFEDFTMANRGRLVMAALTVLKSYLDAGQPDKMYPRLGSFEGWSDLVRSPLVWLGESDPVETQRELAAQDDERQTLGALLQSWYDRYGSTPQTARDVCLGAINSSGDLRDTLLEVALDRSGDITPRRLGGYLRNRNRSVVNGMRFEEHGRNRLNTTLWRVTVLPPSLKLCPASPAQEPQTTAEQGFEGAGHVNSSPAPSANGKHSDPDPEEMQDMQKPCPAPLNNGKSTLSAIHAGHAGHGFSESDEYVNQQEVIDADEF